MVRVPSNSSREKSGPKPGAAAGAPARLAWYRPRVLILLAIVAGAVVLSPYARDWLPDLSALAEYQVDARSIQVTPPNRWVPDDLAGQVIRQAELPEQLSLLDDGLAEKLAAAFADHPWVARVVQVRTSRETGISVDLEYRTPVLMVETGRGAYPVDVEGVLLPPADFSVAEARRFPHLRNVKSQPAGPAGVPWGDVIVVGAARLATTLAPGQDLSRYWDRFQLEAIEAPVPGQAEPQLAELNYELVTRGGSRIVWGRPPGGDELEPPPAQKLGRLEQYLSRYGSFEAPDGPYRIDIRHFEVIEVGSLSETKPRTR
jgi:hypothetical protein